MHPGLETLVEDLWERVNLSRGMVVVRKLQRPELRLHCQRCEGERTFRCAHAADFPDTTTSCDTSLLYRCGDCGVHIKRYSLNVAFNDRPTGSVTKYGEIPGFGAPVPNRVLRMFGRDSALFLKGRQCENQGLGVGAFAYYRRVVENHKNDLIDEIMKACEVIAGTEQLVIELRAAKAAFSFSDSIDMVKAALPASLMIDGRNPLTALHRALSEGLHNESDEDCLKSAGAVRLVLTELINRTHMLKQDNRELNEAMRLLLAKQAKD